MPRLDHDRIVEVHEREALRMVVAVVGLGQVLRDELVRQVAVDAARHRVVRPCAHDAYWSFMTWQFLQARGSVREVAEPFGVVERERTDAGDGPGQHGEQHRGLPEQEHNAALYPHHVGYHLTTEN